MKNIRDLSLLVSIFIFFTILLCYKAYDYVESANLIDNKKDRIVFLGSISIFPPRVNSNSNCISYEKLQAYLRKDLDEVALKIPQTNYSFYKDREKDELQLTVRIIGKADDQAYKLIQNTIVHRLELLNKVCLNLEKEKKVKFFQPGEFFSSSLTEEPLNSNSKISIARVFIMGFLVSIALTFITYFTVLYLKNFLS